MEPPLRGEFYDVLLIVCGHHQQTTSDDVMQRYLSPSIGRFKRNWFVEADPLFDETIETMTAAGADAVVVGCAEAQTVNCVAVARVRNRAVRSKEAGARAVCIWVVAARPHAG